MKSIFELRLLIICGAIAITLFFIGLIVLLSIMIYSLIIIGDILLIRQIGFVLMIIMINIIFLRLFSAVLVRRFEFNNKQIVFNTLLCSIVSSKNKITKLKDYSNFVLLRVVNQETEKRKYLMIMKSYYKESDLSHLNNSLS